MYRGELPLELRSFFDKYVCTVQAPFVHPCTVLIQHIIVKKNYKGNTNYQSGVNNSQISNVNNLHIIRSNNLQTTGSNNSATRMSLAPVVGSPPGRMTLASPGRIQIASNLQANSAIIGKLDNSHLPKFYDCE